MFSNFTQLIEATSRMSIEALINGLWQGVALTAIIWALIKIAPRISPRGRFAIWAATLAVIVGLPFVTGQKLLPPVMAKYFIAGEEHQASSQHASNDAASNNVAGSEPSVIFADYSNERANDLSDASSVSTESESLMPLGIVQTSPAITTTENSNHLGHRTSNGDNLTLPISAATVTPAGKFLSTANNNTNNNSATNNALFSFVLSQTGAFTFFGLWLLISMTLILRLAYSYWSLQNLQSNANKASAGLTLQFENWKSKQGITRKVKLLVSKEISVPLAVGFGSPAVILPAEILESLTSEELDLVFVHELAHLKRHDDWSVFWQQIAQALFFVNPATIWVARRMDFERELACDNEVVSYIGSPRKYAACLARLAELSTVPKNSALVAGTFIRKNRLVARVERLLDSATFGRSRASKATVIATFAVLALAVAQFTLIPAVVAIEEPQRGITVIAPRVPMVDIHDGSGDDNELYYNLQSAETDLIHYENQRKDSEERISALRKSLSKLENQSRKLTPNHRVLLNSYKRQIKSSIKNLELLNKSMERHAERGYGYSYGSGGDVIYSVPGAAPVVAISSSSNASGYSYSYITPKVSAAPAIAPTMSITALPSGMISITPPNAPNVSSISRISGISSAGNTIIAVPGITIDGDGSWNITSDDGETNFNWSEGRHKIRVRSRGDFVFNDDETDIESISDEGFFTVRERDRGVDREYEVLADDDGKLDKTYYEDGRRAEINDDAKDWISETILFVLRNSTIGAENRAERILAKDGVEGIIKEISLIESDHVKRAYYSASFNSGKMSATQIQEALFSISAEIDSDYEKAQILSEIDENSLNDAKTLAAYVETVNTIDSDYEKRRSLGTVLSREDLPKEVALNLLRAAESFESDYERAELLRGLSESGLSDEDVVDAYAEAIAGIESDYEKRRALGGITNRRDLSRETVLGILKMAQGIGSDYERAELLSDMYRYTKDDDVYADAYYEAIVDIESDYEKRRVLSKLLERKTISEAMTLKVLNLAESIDSDYERTELLIDMSRFNEGHAEFYKAYVQALKDVDSDYDTHRALKKLDISEETPNEVRLDVLSIIDGFDSDYEKAGALKKLVHLYIDNDSLNNALLDVIDNIDSDYERDRVLAALYKADRSSYKSKRSKDKKNKDDDDDNRDGRD